MNRAWIPAGALASVSVAGLIALGPLTDSLGTQVSFPNSVPVATQAETANDATAPIRVSLGVAGTVQTAALSSRGGKSAARSQVAPQTKSSDTGFVSNRRAAVKKTTVKAAVTPPKAKPKKVVKRQTSIGTTGETNSDNGLASGANGGTSSGEQAPTLGSD